LEKKELSLTRKDILKLFDRKHFIDHSIKKQVREGKRHLPCGAGKTTLTMMPEGDVYFCQFLKSIGNARKERISDIWNSNLRKHQIKVISKSNICNDCYFSCDIYSSVESSFPLTIKMGLIQYLLKWGIINDK
jgi:MoaA/NifB/PqqE/SkfB family radical SAM enzyme